MDWVSSELLVVAIFHGLDEPMVIQALYQYLSTFSHICIKFLQEKDICYVFLKKNDFERIASSVFRDNQE